MPIVIKVISDVIINWFIMNKYFVQSILLKSWLFAECRKVSRSIFIYSMHGEIKERLVSLMTESDVSLDYAMEKEAEYSSKYPRLWHICKNMCHAYVSRVARLKNRIYSMLIDVNSGELKPCIFLTLSFSDEFLQSTSSLTRRRYISKFLNSLKCAYVANIDFGNDNYYKARDGTIRQGTKREHYHALVQCDFVDYSTYKYGLINGERVRHGKADMSKLSKYVAKLTNHAIKESTKRSVLLYSRKFK